MNSPERSFRASLAAMIGICLVFMLIALDATIVGTAMPRVIAELKGYELYTWTAAAYLLSNTVMILITGRLGDLYGRKPFMIAAILLFTFASALCGLAQSMIQLILARCLQGVGGGMIYGVAFASVSDLFPERVQRARWITMLTATYGLATAVGPSLGGWLTEAIGWRSVFYVNVPIALVALVVVAIYLPRVVNKTSEKRSVDWLSAILLTATIGALLFATEQGHARKLDWPLMTGLVVLALLCGVFFVRHQHRSKAPVIPPRLLANPAALTLGGLSALTGFVMYALIYYAPLLLQGGFALSPQAAGLMQTPLLVMLAVGTFANGRLITYVKHPSKTIAFGQVLLFVSCILMAQLQSSSSHLFIMVAFSMAGLALGLQLPNITIQMQSAVEVRDIGVASAVAQSARLLGSMIGISVAGVIINSSFAVNVDRLLESVGTRSEMVSSLLASPQILVRASDEARFVELGQSLNFDALLLLQHARGALVGGVHHAWVACLVVVVFSLVLTSRLLRANSKQRLAMNGR